MTSIWQIGVDAAHMVDLPDVIQVSSPLQIVGGTITSLGGSQTQHVMARKAQITLTFDYMTDAEYDAVLAYFDGRQGAGPFVYQDPREASTRTVNIASLSDDSSGPEGYRDSGTTMVLNEV